MFCGCFFVYGYRREPLDGTAFRRFGHEFYAGIFSSSCLYFLYMDLLLSMRSFKVEHLASAYGGEYVAHSVVVAYFSVFIPRRFVSGLGGPESGFVYVLFVIGYEHSAAGGGYTRSRVCRNIPRLCRRSRIFCRRICAQSFSRVFQYGYVVFIAYGAYFVHFGRLSVEFGYYYAFRHFACFYRVVECFLKSDRRHIPSLFIGVYEYRHGVLVDCRRY